MKTEGLHGISFGLPAERYFAEPALSNSGIKKLLQSPAHFKYSLSAPIEETPALIIGSAIHCAVLEPEFLLDRYGYMQEGMDRRTKEGKAAYEALVSSGKTVLSGKDFDLVMSVSESVSKHETAAELLSNGEAEVSCFTEIAGVPAKCRADWLRHDGIVIDLKTTDDASQLGFRRSVARYGYEVQAAWYLDCLESLGIAAHTFVFVAVEKDEPHGIGIYELDADALQLGRELYQRAAALYKHCSATNEWPGYDSGIVELSVPAWAFQQVA